MVTRIEISPLSSSALQASLLSTTTSFLYLHPGRPPRRLPCRSLQPKCASQAQLQKARPPSPLFVKNRRWLQAPPCSKLKLECGNMLDTSVAPLLVRPLLLKPRKCFSNFRHDIVCLHAPRVDVRTIGDLYRHLDSNSCLPGTTSHTLLLVSALTRKAPSTIRLSECRVVKFSTR